MNFDPEKRHIDEVPETDLRAGLQKTFKWANFQKLICELSSRKRQADEVPELISDLRSRKGT